MQCNSLPCENESHNKYKLCQWPSSVYALGLSLNYSQRVNKLKAVCDHLQNLSAFARKVTENKHLEYNRQEVFEFKECAVKLIFILDPKEIKPDVKLRMDILRDFLLFHSLVIDINIAQIFIENLNIIFNWGSDRNIPTQEDIYHTASCIFSISQTAIIAASNKSSEKPKEFQWHSRCYPDCIEEICNYFESLLKTNI